MKAIKFFLQLFLVSALLISCTKLEEVTVEEISADDISSVMLKSADVSLDLEGRYIVVFKENVANPAMEAERMRGLFGIEKGHVYEHALKGFSAKIPPQALNGLRNHPLIDYIEPDLIMTAFAETVPKGISRINAVTPLYTTVLVDVAVIDTGIDADHPDLTVMGGVRYYQGFLTDSKYDDDHGHGTHVAGTIGAKNSGTGVIGVAPGTRLWAVKVLDSRGSGYVSDIIKGIDWVMARATTIEVVNMSLGGQGISSSYQAAIRNCVGAGVVVVVAAGNEAVDVYGADRKFGTSDDRIPAAYPEAMTISALADSDGQPGGLGAATSYGPDDSFASFSNYSYNVVAENQVESAGKAIDLMLPGVNILSTYKGGGYATMSGTSMASPHAAGLVARYINEHARATTASGVYAIRQALISGGVLQTATEGLNVHNDPDENLERLGWQGAALDQGENQLPVANFTFTTSGLTATFTNTSNDPDGSIASSLWNFGDGSTSSISGPSGTTKTYLAAGTYTVTLTVTDNDAATSSLSDLVNVTITEPAGIVLTARGYKVRAIPKVDLAWTGADGYVDIYRNGSLIKSNVGVTTYTDTLPKGGGSYTYKVCESGTIHCSNDVTVTF